MSGSNLLSDPFFPETEVQIIKQLNYNIFMIMIESFFNSFLIYTTLNSMSTLLIVGDE
jgi:hypothetical protein